MQDQILLEILNQLKQLNETSEIIMQQNERILRDMGQIGELLARSQSNVPAQSAEPKTSKFLDASGIK